MVLLVNTFGHNMPLDSMKTMLEIMIVRAMMDLNLKPLLMLVVTIYCESGYSGNGHDCGIFHNSDPLWDGQQCGGLEAPCCTHPNMPWFIKTLSETTTEDIELRPCTTNEGCTGTVPIFLIELYI